MSTGKKKGLGRGLSALFGDEKPVAKNKETTSSNKVSISDLSRNPYQPRQSFSEEKLEELAQSIKKNGIIHPIAVRPSKSDKSKYEIVAGERRWLAAQRAGLHEIPVTILNLSDVRLIEALLERGQKRFIFAGGSLGDKEFQLITDKGGTAATMPDYNPLLEVGGVPQFNGRPSNRFVILVVTEKQI